MNSGLLIGCDFSSSPTRRKPILLASGTAEKGRVLLLGLERIESLQAFECWLGQQRSWSNSSAGRQTGHH
jgi:hypothetical protein